MNRRRPWLVVAACAWLAGCGGDDLNEVREFVRTAHADRKPRVEPLPEIKIQETFTYGAATFSDPFAPFNVKPQDGRGSAAGPDPHRRRGPLEVYPLDALKMVGTLMRGRQVWAVIQAPDGTVHRTQVGEYLGQNSGQIVRISEERIDLVELIQGPLGDWVEREARLTLLE
jgi:type IV pilus assembly protein PilP